MIGAGVGPCFVAVITAPASGGFDGQYFSDDAQANPLYTDDAQTNPYKAKD